MNKAKIKAASYRNMRKTTSSSNNINKKKQINNEDDGNMTASMETNNLVNSTIMDPIEEISSKKEEESIFEEKSVTEDINETNKENFKKVLQQHLKTHSLNEPKIHLNKSNQSQVRINSIEKNNKISF